MRAIVLCAALLCCACGKKSYTPFYQLEGDSTVLVLRDGEDAWESAEMDRIVTGLQNVPANALEKEKADALIAKITGERARLVAERARFAEVRTTPVAARPEPAPAPVVEAAPPPTTAKTPEEPYAGMKEDEFLKLFGNCFATGEPGDSPDGGVARYFRALGTPENCARFAKPPDTRFALFVDGAYFGTATRVDAGVKPAPEPEAKPEAPKPPKKPAEPTIIETPYVHGIIGAPLPEGVSPLDAG